MVVRLFQRPYDFQRQPIRARNIGGNSERLAELLRAVVHSGGLGGTNVSDFTPDIRWESPGAHLEELWTMGAPIFIQRNLSSGVTSYLVRPLSGIDAVISDITNWVDHAATNHPFVLFPLDALQHAPDGMRTNDMVDAINLNEDRAETLLRDLVRFGWCEDVDDSGVHRGESGFVRPQSRKRRNESGSAILEDFTGGLTFVSNTEDLESFRELRWMWCMLRAIVGGESPGSYPLLRPLPPYEVEVAAIIELFNSSNMMLSRNGGRAESIEELEHILQRLGIDHTCEAGTLVLCERLFLKTNCRDYLRAGLPEIDRAFFQDRIQEANQSWLISSPPSDVRGARVLVVCDSGINSSNHPEGAVQVHPIRFGYDVEWRAEVVIFRDPRPGLLQAFSARLHAFVHAGGRFILHRMRSGRRGRTFNALNGLPSDFERLGVTDSGWRFDNTLLPDTPVEPIYTQEFRPQPDGRAPLTRFGARYGRGWWVFVHDEPSRELYEELLEEYPVEGGYNLDTEGPHWRYQHIAEIPTRVRAENQIYRQIGQTEEGEGFLHQELGFEFSNTFSNEWLTGAVGGADLWAVLPEVLVIEVDSLGIGSDPSPDQSHQTRTADYRITARSAISRLYGLIANAQGDDLESWTGSITTQISQAPLRQQPIIREVFERHLEAHLSEGLDLDTFGDRIRQLGVEEPGPPTMLLGKAYGMPEDARRSSAREHSQERRYSLWTYRDLYEFIVRTDGMESEQRRDHLLALCMTAGPVYFALRDRLPV